MKILIAGVGAIGSNLVRFLAPDLKGEHKITVLDMDKVEERNITAGTQWYTHDQIGMSKVEAIQFNVYKWYEREIEIINQKLSLNNFGFIPESDLIIDCFDNHDARAIIQTIKNTNNKIINKLHIGFSDQFTFAIEWAENYQVPTDITSGMDICEMPGAAAFVNRVASLGAMVAEEFIRHEAKLEITGGRFNQNIIK